MAYCCVPHCRSHGRRTAPELSFHEIPADWDLRESWIRAIGRDNWVPNTTSNYSKVCSKHFKETDFIEGKRRRLVKGVIPSVFEDTIGAKRRNGGRVRKTCCSDDVREDRVGRRKVQKRSEGAEQQVEAPPASPPSIAAGDGAANEPTEETGADLERGESRSPQNVEEGTPSESSQAPACEMGGCCVPLCKSSHRSPGRIALHEFPVTEVRNDWIRNISRLAAGPRQEPWVPNDRSKVCSLHFKPEDYREGVKLRRLKPDAVPTVFPDRPASPHPAAKKDGPKRAPATPPSPAEVSPASARKARFGILCAVPKCDSRAGVTHDVLFHEIPANLQRRQSWLDALRSVRPVGDKSWQPSDHTKICSKHFKPEDYIQGPKKRYLAPHAVPSKFPRTAVKSLSKAAAKSVTSRVSRAVTANKARTRDLSNTSSFSSSSSSVKTTDRSCQTDQKRLELSTASHGQRQSRSIQVSLVESQNQLAETDVPRDSVGCQTLVTGLTIAAYQDQMLMLKDQCNRLQAELLELRHRNAVLTAAASVVHVAGK